MTAKRKQPNTKIDITGWQEWPKWSQDNKPTNNTTRHNDVLDTLEPTNDVIAMSNRPRLMDSKD